MNPPIFVPRRSDRGIRDAIWSYLRPKWEERGHEIFEGHHDTREGPFNRARAVNRAARSAGDWDVGLIIDADIWVDAEQVDAAVDAATATGALSFCHTEWWGTTPHTRRLCLKGTTSIERWPFWADRSYTVKNPLSNSCAMIVTRQLWEDVGGYDERFCGWGAEDWAWHVACETLGGPPHRQPHPVIHLHHPLSEQAKLAHMGREDAVLAANHRLGRRYLDARDNPDLFRKMLRDAKANRER